MDFPASHGEAGHPMGLPCRLFDAPVSTMDFGISLGGRISWNLWPVEDRHGEISEHVMPVRYVRYCFLLQKANKSTRTLVTALRTWIWYIYIYMYIWLFFIQCHFFLAVAFCKSRMLCLRHKIWHGYIGYISNWTCPEIADLLRLAFFSVGKEGRRNSSCPL